MSSLVLLKQSERLLETLVSFYSDFDPWSPPQSMAVVFISAELFVAIEAAAGGYYCGYYDQISIKLFVRSLHWVSISLMFHQLQQS